MRLIVYLHAFLHTSTNYHYETNRINTAVISQLPLATQLNSAVIFLQLARCYSKILLS